MNKKRKGGQGSDPARRGHLHRPGHLCDPGMCDECLYIGEGDFLCDEHQTIVVSDWEPTKDYLICEREATE